jgi:hypothetical protein
MPEARRLPPPASVMRMRVDLASMGYAAEEFAVAGEARRFAWSEAAGRSLPDVELAGTAPYCTRVVVFRPRDPTQRSGTAVVEWLNCRDGTDTVPQWLRMHREIVRSGMTWVGVSAQRLGIEGGGGQTVHLKALDPAKYGHLHHPGDAFSFDIFGQAARLVADGALFAGMPRCVLGVGSSQSARFLTAYVNVMDRLDRSFDGFLLTGRHRSAAALDGASICGKTVRLRSDLAVPVMVLQPETDIFGRMRSFEVRQADTDRFRLWEIAGAAHADSYIASVGRIDDGTADPATLAAAYCVEPTARLPLRAPMNASPAFHYVHQAALKHLEAWATAGTLPPAAPLLEGDIASGIVRDRCGIALGGVRTPWTDCPAAIHSGENDEDDDFAGLFGRTLPLPRGMLETLYPGGVGDYMRHFASALDRSVEGGFLLAEDSEEIMQLASASFPSPREAPACAAETTQAAPRP